MEAVRYCVKYCTKPQSDKTVYVSKKGCHEIMQFKQSRVINPNEAVFRLLGYNLSYTNIGHLSCDWMCISNTADGF